MWPTLHHPEGAGRLICSHHHLHHHRTERNSIRNYLAAERGEGEKEQEEEEEQLESSSRSSR